MSFSTLGIGASALVAAQRAVETAAHNVANSTVEGYTRQRVNLAASRASAGTNGMRGSGMRGTGVEVVSIERLRDDLADRAVRSQAGATGSANARALVLDRAQGVLGPVSAGLSASLDELWSAFDTLSVTPEGGAQRQLTLDAASRVAQGVQDAARELGAIREDALGQLRETVAKVNASGRQVAVLNEQIAAALVGGQAPNDLLDQRDRALDALADLTGATPRTRPDGMVDVVVGRSGARARHHRSVARARHRPPDAPSVSVPVNLDGRQFGFAAGAGQDVFAVLDRLETAVRSGDLAGVTTSQGELAARFDDVTAALGQVGAKTYRVQAAVELGQTVVDSLVGQRSQVEDIDLAATVLRLPAAENGYTAALGAVARADLPSLANFLR